MCVCVFFPTRLFLQKVHAGQASLCSDGSTVGNRLAHRERRAGETSSCEAAAENSQMKILGYGWMADYQASVLESLRYHGIARHQKLSTATQAKS